MKPNQKVSDEELIECLSDGMSVKQISDKFGMSPRVINRRKAQLVKRGYSPEHDMNHVVPEGYKLRGTSTLYLPNGEQVLQWVKTSADAERQREIMEEAIRALSEDIPRTEVTPPPEISNEKLLTLYPISDLHFGMLADQEESGDDWDIKIAESTVTRWLNCAIQASPDSHNGVLLLLGDQLHFDGLEAVTPKNRHVLDNDSRFWKVVRNFIRVVRNITGKLLEKHQVVDLVVVPGNHDEASSVWIREFMAAFYENEPRITVDTRPDPYYCIEHGNTSLFFHHGHLARFERLEQAMIAKFREVFGRTKYSYIHVGHLHHKKVAESSLAIVEQHQTLAAKDAYASSGAWLSQRAATAIVYHADYGEVSRATIRPEMLK